MTVFWTLVRRELGGYFVSLTGYVVIATVLFLLGLGFLNLVLHLNTEASDVPLTELFYQTIYFWLILLLATPVITMRSYAQEKYTGTYETLMTAPVSDLEVVMAKFVGSLMFYLVMWFPLLGCLLLMHFYSGESSVLSGGVLAGTALGILLLGTLYVSMGCFASALTRSQIIAAMISFALGVALFVLGFLSATVPNPSDWTARLFEYISMRDHMSQFVRGTVDTRAVVFYVTLTTFFLFLNCKVVEVRRWR